MTQRTRRNASPEGDLKLAIRQLCALHRIPCYVIGVGALRVGSRFVRLGTPGLPDLVLLTHRGTVWVECKSKRGVLSPEQQQFYDACRERGIPWVLAREPSDVMPWV